MAKVKKFVDRFHAWATGPQAKRDVALAVAFAEAAWEFAKQVGAA